MKVNLGSNNLKKSYFPISFDSSSTSNFGEVIPFFCQEVTPNSHVSLSVRDAVRFAPLSFPTFGKAYKKNYFFAHNIQDLYPPFRDLLAQTEYTSSIGSTYIPSSVPSVPLWFLWLSVVTNCEFSFYRTPKTDIRKYGTDSPFVVGDINYTAVTNVSVDENAEVPLPLEDVCYSFPFWLMHSLISMECFNNSGNSGVSFNNLPISSDFNNLYSYISGFESSSNSNLDRIFYDSVGSNVGCVFCTGIDDPNGNFRPLVTPSSADYIFPISVPQVFGMEKKNNGSSVTSYPISGIHDSFRSQADYNMFVCIRLTDSGKFLRKLFLGLGYQIAPCDSYVSLLPLYAYFKSYFNTFAPKRFVKFEQTYFSRLINCIVQDGSSVIDYLSAKSPEKVFGIGWSQVIDDLLSCFYTKDTDYYSSQIIGLINDYGKGLTADYISVNDANESSVSTIGNPLDTDDNVTPSVNLSGSTNHTQSQQNILSRLSQFVNRRSVIGGKLSSLLKSVFGISEKDISEYNAYIGSTSLDVNFSDVFSTAETAEGSLGEYAGKAMAFSQTDEKFNFDTDNFTYLIGVTVIVPRTQYVQGVNPLLFHVNNNDFYNHLYDGLTLLPTRKSSLYTNELFFNSIDSERSFGNSPIYSEYKTKSCGVLNGDLSLRSTRSTYDSFTMDELISGSFNNEPSNTYGKGQFKFVQYDFSNLAAGTMWRYLGRWLWLGRFDRIFVNNRLSFYEFLGQQLDPSVSRDLQSTRNLYRSDDNLVLHHVVDIVLNSPMVPLSGSFLTDDLLSLDPNGITVESE